MEQTLRTSARRSRLLWFSLGLAVFLIVLDQVTKALVRSALSPGMSMWELGIVRLTYVANSGAAFGLFTNQTIILTVISLIAAGMMVVFLRHPPLRNRPGGTAIGLLLGGCIGNLIDRIRIGYVTDFIDFGPKHGYHFYTFNAADSAITIGIIVLAIALLRMGSQTTTSTPKPSDGK